MTLPRRKKEGRNDGREEGREEEKERTRKKEGRRKKGMKEELGCGSDGRMHTALGIKASTQAFGGSFPVYNYDTFGDV